MLPDMKAIEENLTRSNGKIRTIVTDMDEVLVNIQTKWVMAILADEQLRPKIDPKVLRKTNGELISTCEDLEMAVIARDNYYITNWLGLTEQKDIDRVLELYFSNGDTFYDDLQPNRFTQGIKAMQDNPGIDRIIVLSHVRKDVDNSSKERWVPAQLPHEKVELIQVDLSIPKSEVINEVCPEYALFVDDRADIIIDVIKNTDSKNCEFMMPLFGYNFDQRNAVQAVAKEHGACFGTYRKVNV